MKEKTHFQQTAAGVPAAAAAKTLGKRAVASRAKRNEICQAIGITIAMHAALSKAHRSDLEQALCAMGKNGKGPVEIAKATAKLRQTISNILKKHGVVPSYERKKTYLEQIAADNISMSMPYEYDTLFKAAERMSAAQQRMNDLVWLRYCNGESEADDFHEQVQTSHMKAMTPLKSHGCNFEDLKTETVPLRVARCGINPSELRLAISKPVAIRKLHF